MGPRTRRSALRGVAAALVALAGCSTSSSHDRPERTPPEHQLADPPSVVLRNPDRGHFVYVPPPGGGSPSGTPRGRDGVVSEKTLLDDLVFTADVEGVAEARRFLSETDFDTSSVVVVHDSIGACFELEACHVGWSDTEVVVRLRERFRDPDVACEADAHHTAAAFVRIPDTLSDSVVRDLDARSGDLCRTPDHWRETATPPPGGPGDRRGGPGG